MKKSGANFSDCVQVHKLADKKTSVADISNKLQLKEDLVERIIESKAFHPDNPRPAQKGSEHVEPATKTIAETVKEDRQKASATTGLATKKKPATNNEG